MARFAYVRKFCIYAKFANVCKSGHVYTALDALSSDNSEDEIREVSPVPDTRVVNLGTTTKLR